MGRAVRPGPPLSGTVRKDGEDDEAGIARFKGGVARGGIEVDGGRGATGAKGREGAEETNLPRLRRAVHERGDLQSPMRGMLRPPGLAADRVAAMSGKAKRGRPPGGQPAFDRGTPELQARRARLAGRGGEALTAYPLGVLLANGDIGEDAHEAGCRYAWLYGFVFGRTGAAGQSWLHAPKGEPREFPHEIAAAIERDFRAAAALLAQNGAGKTLLEELVVFGREPRWMRPVAPTMRDIAEARLFHAALAALTRHFKGEGSRNGVEAARKSRLTT